MQNQTLKASVIIPTKNNAKTVEQCLASLMPYRQYIQDIIVVDGRSSDGTLDIVRKFPVDKILADLGKGQNLAYEMGWRNSEGDLVVFMDADAYLDEGFFPAIFNYFEDEALGIVGCPSRLVITNALSKVMTQWAEYGSKVRVNPDGILEKMHRAAWMKNQGDILPCGPCQAVPRKCLEAIDGYRGASIKLPTDAILAYRIINKGWKGYHWLDAPVYHHPRTTTKELMKEFERFGKERVYFQRDPEITRRFTFFQQAAYLLGNLASPLLGLILALRFKNPRHAVLYPLTRYASVAGYFTALRSREKAARVA